MDGLQALALAKKYTKDTSDSLGSLKGAPCRVKSIEQLEEGSKVTFEWEGKSGALETDYVILKNGPKGKDGVGISDISKSGSEELVDTYTITLSNDETYEFQVKNGKDGERGFSINGCSFNEKGELVITLENGVALPGVMLPSASVSISKETNNIISQRDDGLYVPKTNLEEYIKAETVENTFVKKEEGKSLVSDEDIQSISESKTAIGEIENIEVKSWTDIVTAINALYNSTVTKIECSGTKLKVTFADKEPEEVDVSSIISTSKLGDLQNVDDSEVTSGQVLAYDSESSKYKPKTFDLAAVLTQAKAYTDREITNSVKNHSIACDEKPVYNDGEKPTITYILNGITYETEATETWFFYHVDGDTFQTKWVSGVEFTIDALDTDFTQFVQKTDIADSYTGEEIDKTKIASLKALDDLAKNVNGLPEPEVKDKMFLSAENAETSELEWVQVDKGTIDGSAYVNLDVGSDFNTLITHGRFRTTTKRIDRIGNLPVQVAGMLTVRLTGSIIYQTYKTVDNEMYTRTSEDAGENWSDWKDVSEGDSSFIGTKEEWDNLTLEEKAKYDGKEVIFTNDSSDPEPSPSITKTDVTFFIDYENGNDANDGLSEDTPLKTLDFQRIASTYNKYTRFGFNLMSDYPEPVEILNTSIVVIKSNGASASTPLENNYTLKGGIYFGNTSEAFLQFVNVSSENNTSGVLVDFQNCGMAYLGYSKITYSRNSNGRAVRVLKCSGISINGIEIKNTTTKVLYGITVGTSCVYMLQGNKVSSIDSSVDYGYSFVDGGGIVYIPGNTYKQITPKALQDGVGAIFVDGQLITTKYESTYEGEKIDLQNKPTVKSATPSGGAYTKPSGVTTAVQGGCAYGDKYIQLFNTGYFGIYSIKDFDKGTNQKTPLAYGQLGSFDTNNHANSLTFGKKYSDTDEFPLLYLTGYRDSIDSAEQLGSCCYVDRLVSNGSGYTSEHIQTIYIDYSTYAGTKFVETFHYHNYLVDIENGYLYTFAPKWRSNGSQSEHDSENRYYLTRFKIPEITNPTVTLTANDILAQFELPYDATFTQGATIHNGFLYHVFGQGNSTVHPNCIRVYNLMTGKESAKIDCSKFNWQTREPESLTVYDNKLLVMVQNMYIHYLQFA